MLFLVFKRKTVKISKWSKEIVSVLSKALKFFFPFMELKRKLKKSKISSPLYLLRQTNVDCFELRQVLYIPLH